LPGCPGSHCHLPRSTPCSRVRSATRQLFLYSRLRPTMQMAETTPATMVSRSRLRSTTEEPDRLEYSDPPNIEDRPPPLPRCNSTSTTSSRLTAISTNDRVRIIGCSGLVLHESRSRRFPAQLEDT